MSGPEPGLEILPGLTLLRRLGRGGMGEAWLARDAARGTEVVAKLLPADAPPERLALLRREARLVRKLQHPGIVPVIDFQAGERFCAVTLRHMPGGDAHGLRGAPTASIVWLARDVAAALSYLHELGVVHRDVKASNVLLDANGRAQLADFGIASDAHDDEDGIVLRGGGSRASMSPQQRAGEPSAPADDLYALGVLLLELLTGETPAEGEAPAATSRLRAPQVPERLRGLVAALVAPSPEHRPPSAAAVRDELDAIGASLAPQPAEQRRELRLQPPPRAVDRAPSVEEGPELFVQRPAGGGSVISGRVLVLGALVALALAAAFWLPDRVRPVSEPEVPPTPTSPVPATPEAPHPEATPAVSASAAPSEPKPAEAPDPPAEKPPATLARRSQGREPATPEPPQAEPAPAEPEPAPTPDQAVEARALAGHREQGARLEEREEWRVALQQYEAALAIDAHVSFALEGRERAEKRALLDEALEAHLKRPERLSFAPVGREAEALLERARGIQPAGPVLERQTEALEAALATARKPVRVVIESDGLTELTLSRVGALGALTHHSLELLPGSYTVTGSRRGYRDVRRQFTVKAGEPGPIVSLRCEETL